MTAYAGPLPVPTAESRPFWDACLRHELLVQRCGRCRAHRLPPARLCPECLDGDADWVRASGRGTVYSFAVYHRVYHEGLAGAVPYVVAVVELEEGPRIVSNLVGVDPAEAACDLPVEVVFDDVTETVTLPKFRPRA